MKGFIRANQGASRYTLGVSPNDKPAAELLEKLKLAYDDAGDKLLKAQEEWLALYEPYQEILIRIADATSEYNICIQAFNLSGCVADRIAQCEATFIECESACYEIESGPNPGQCDYQCWQQRDACQEQCDRDLNACLAVAKLECQEAHQKAMMTCQETWIPQIAAIQAEGAKAYPAVQAALVLISDLEALRLSLARRMTELEQTQALEQQIVCFRAQYDDEIAVGTEVDVARTPSGRTVITSIVSPDACWQDARALPGTHLFVNAAVAPGFETWRPNWRVGTVLAIKEDDDKLQVAVSGGTIAGSLGTIYSQNPLDCTPPQAYFDGNWATAEQRIRDARALLADAQEVLNAAVKDRDDCLEQFDETWRNGCYTDKAALCDQTWLEWLAACDAAGGAQICLDAYDICLEACGLQAQADCLDERDAALEDCHGIHDPLVADAQDAADLVAGNLSDKLGELGAAQVALADLMLEIEECEAGFGDDWLAACDKPEFECLEMQEVNILKCTTDRAQEIADLEDAIQELEAEVGILETDKLAADGYLQGQQAALQDCLAEFDAGWVETCTAGKTAECQADCAEELAACDSSACLDQYKVSLAGCYAQAQADCSEEQDVHHAECRAQWQPAVDAAQQVVDEAARDLHLELAGRYDPASPLVLDLPVAHCEAGTYEVDDEVLIDFPTRTGTVEQPMAVWDSARVIGWATETRQCEITLIYDMWWLDHAGETYQILRGGEDGTPVTAIDKRIVYPYNVTPCGGGQSWIVYYAWAKFEFIGWDDGRTDNPRTDTHVTEDLEVAAIGSFFPESMPYQVIYTYHENPGSDPEWLISEKRPCIQPGYNPCFKDDWASQKLGIIDIPDTPVEGPNFESVLLQSLLLSCADLSGYGFQTPERTYVLTGEYTLVSFHTWYDDIETSTGYNRVETRSYVFRLQQ